MSRGRMPTYWRDRLTRQENWDRARGTNPNLPEIPPEKMPRSVPPEWLPPSDPELNAHVRAKYFPPEPKPKPAKPSGLLWFLYVPFLVMLSFTGAGLILAVFIEWARSSEARRNA